LNKKMKKIIILLFIFSPFVVLSQQQITLKEAIDMALKNNFDIQIARNNATISEINNSFGMAGGLPNVNISTADNQSYYNLNQKLSNGSEINKNNVGSNTLNAGISAGMTLFNGFKVMATKERLNLLQKQSDVLLNQQIQNTIASVMVKYYDIIRQQSYLKIIQASLEVSKQKLEIVTQRQNVGMANDADLMQTQIDVNAGEQSLNAQQIIIEQAKTDLLQLMGVNNYYTPTIRDTIIPDKSIQLDSILIFLKQNPQYLSSEYLININEQLVKEISSQRYPTVKINTGYSYNLSQSDAGQYLYNKNFGPYVGATLQIPIYNGNIYKNQRESALINVDNARLQNESLLHLLTASTMKTFKSYSNALKQIVSQQNNQELAARLVALSLKKFQMNQATIIDVKAAQASFEASGYNLINLQYAAKIAEIELRRLTFGIVY